MKHDYRLIMALDSKLEEIQTKDGQYDTKILEKLSPTIQEVDWKALNKACQ